MDIKSAKFDKSSSKVEQCPDTKLPEYAFIGRSNVGKSSLINAMTRNKSLAKTSSTPGKTQLINHFLIDDDWFLADLPGYGYAQVSKVQRAKFQKMIDGYLLNRENLLCTFILVDARHAPLKNDLDFMQWMGNNGLPFVIVFTKADKIKAPIRKQNVNKYKKKLLEIWEEAPQMFLTSSEKGVGLNEIKQFIGEINEEYKKR